MSIPKIIHYCWFGKGEKPELAKKCIESWKKYCSDYEIKEWNEDKFDINSNEYVRQAYEAKKFAFVADYVRLYVLCQEGGIYLDTDVEIIKPIDKFLENKAFAGFESRHALLTGVIAAEKNNPWIQDLFSMYKDLKFIDEQGKMDLTTNVVRITELSEKEYGLNLESSHQTLKNGIVTIYPYDYFCAKDYDTDKICITENTHTIHHFSASWHGEKEKKQAEKYRKRLKKYVKKYGEEKGKIRLNQHDLVVFYLCHPCKAIKRIIEKINGE